MRESAMASFESTLETPSRSGGAEPRPASSGSVLHPEMNEDRMTIPDTAGRFLMEAAESALDRFQRERGGSDVPTSSDDDIRPGTLNPLFHTTSDY